MGRKSQTARYQLASDCCSAKVEALGHDIDPKLKMEAGLRECSRGQEFGVVSATLDGRQLQNLERYRATSSVFNMTVAENNAFQSSSGTFPAMADGFFAFLEPLPPGEHTLMFGKAF